MFFPVEYGEWDVLYSVYCNSLLANLNARAYIRGQGSVHGASPGTDLVIIGPPMSGNQDRTSERGSEIQVFHTFVHDSGWSELGVTIPRLAERKTMEVVAFSDADSQSTTCDNVV